MIGEMQLNTFRDSVATSTESQGKDSFRYTTFQRGSVLYGVSNRVLYLCLPAINSSVIENSTLLSAVV